MDTKLTVDEIQVAVAKMFGVRTYLIIPNVSWGFFATHEADLIAISKSAYITEVEIKRSWSDFLADFKKTTTHDENKVMWKYFAVPYLLKDKTIAYLEEKNRLDWGVIGYTEDGAAFAVKHPVNKNRADQSKRLFLEEQLQLARLGVIRLWTNKEKLITCKRKNDANEQQDIPAADNRPEGLCVADGVD